MPITGNSSWKKKKETLSNNLEQQIARARATILHYREGSDTSSPSFYGHEIRRRVYAFVSLLTKCDRDSGWFGGEHVVLRDTEMLTSIKSRVIHRYRRTVNINRTNARG